MARLRNTITTIEGFAASPAGASEQMTGTTAQVAAAAQLDLGAGAGRLGRGRGGVARRRDGVGGERGDGPVDPGDLVERREAARMTSQGVADTQQATAELARMSTELSGLVSTFRLQVRVPAQLRPCGADH